MTFWQKELIRVRTCVVGSAVIGGGSLDRRELQCTSCVSISESKLGRLQDQVRNRRYRIHHRNVPAVDYSTKVLVEILNETDSSKSVWMRGLAPRLSTTEECLFGIPCVLCGNLVCSFVIIGLTGAVVSVFEIGSTSFNDI